MTKDEALRMAIEYLDEIIDTCQTKGWADKYEKFLLNACKEALKQPAQTYQHKWDRCGERCLKCGDKDWMGGACSVADEQPAQRMTIEQAYVEVYGRYPDTNQSGNMNFYDFKRGFNMGIGLDLLWADKNLTDEQKQAKQDELLGLRNITKQPAQEPDRTGMVYYKNNACKAKDAKSHDCICWTPKQPAQEPVAWMDSEGRFRKDYKTEIVRSVAAANKEIPLYTHPAQPLSDDEIDKILETMGNVNDWNYIDFARAIEQAHGIGVKDGI